MPLILTKLKVGFRIISVETCSSVELVSESDYCQIVMTAIVMLTADKCSQRVLCMNDPC